MFGDFIFWGGEYFSTREQKRFKKRKSFDYKFQVFFVFLNLNPKEAETSFVPTSTGINHQIKCRFNLTWGCSDCSAIINKTINSDVQNRTKILMHRFRICLNTKVFFLLSTHFLIILNTKRSQIQIRSKFVLDRLVFSETLRRKACR